GTLFLDEIETMPVPLQIKMLRVLQERVVERLGANDLIPVDCRVVAASKADLAELAADGRFRADLLYRLNVAQIELPPLRERREDVPLLFEHFVLAAARRFGQPAPVVTAAQVSELMTHAWPGNVRELQNVADRFVLGLTGDSLLSSGDAPAVGDTLAEQLAYFERMLIEDMLQRHNGNVADASVALGMPKKTLYHKLRNLRIPARGDAAADGSE
ncbi:MAG: sigma-54-dependent Fis family transcriptional regulator, partial [Burkholderia sp.]|nr:sigma-54-dependent Fis family transcriptional regulator [Burkholderia sp.]